jgi:hypothetical protein
MIFKPGKRDLEAKAKASESGANSLQAGSHHTAQKPESKPPMDDDAEEPKELAIELDLEIPIDDGVEVSEDPVHLALPADDFGPARDAEQEVKPPMGDGVEVSEDPAHLALPADDVGPSMDAEQEVKPPMDDGVEVSEDPEHFALPADDVGPSMTAEQEVFLKLAMDAAHGAASEGAGERPAPANALIESRKNYRKQKILEGKRRLECCEHKDLKISEDFQQTLLASKLLFFSGPGVVVSLHSLSCVFYMHVICLQYIVFL